MKINIKNTLIISSLYYLFKNKNGTSMKKYKIRLILDIHIMEIEKTVPIR